MPSKVATVAAAHARVAGLAKNHADPADIDEARRDLKALKAQEYIRRLVDSAPPLSELQRARLAAFLLPAVREAAA